LVARIKGRAQADHENEAFKNDGVNTSRLDDRAGAHSKEGEKRVAKWCARGEGKGTHSAGGETQGNLSQYLTNLMQKICFK